MFKSWILASRPKTLTAGIIPILAATALVVAERQPIHVIVLVAALLATLCIQIATNLFNDAIDFKKGADTAERLGPRRMTSSGELSQKQVVVAGFTFAFLALLFGIPLVFIGGWPILIVGVLSLFLAYLYTGGPCPLAYVGLGDIFVVLFFGVIAVGGVYYLHTGTLSIGAFILGLQVGFLSTVLIAINNLRDMDQDAKVNKKTLAVIMGKKFVVAEIGSLILITFLAQTFWFFKIGLWSFGLPLIMLPLGLRIINQVRLEPPSALYNRFLAQAALLHAGFGLLLSIGLLLR